MPPISLRDQIGRNDQLIKQKLGGLFQTTQHMIPDQHKGFFGNLKGFFKPIGKILRRETPIQQKITSFLHPPEERTPVGGMHLGKETLNLYSQPQGGIGLDPFGFAGGLRRVGKQVSKKITESVGQKISKGVEEFTDTLRGTKGMTADDIMKKYPDIQLKRDVPAKDIYGNKVELPKGLALRPYEMKGNKVLLQDGETYIVTKNQFANIKGQSISGEAKTFAPELEGLEESVRVTKVDKLGNEIGLQNPKFSQYQLPEGKNYKEILFTAPEKKITELPSGVRIKKDADGYYAVNDAGAIITRAFKDKQGLLDSFQNRERGFYSHAFPEKNNYGWLRINEHTNKKYGDITFLEEAQHIKPKELGGLDNITLAQYDALPKHMKGNEFYRVHLKRALKEAVENDSDYFAWINGEQTSARYNLANHLDYAKWKVSSDYFARKYKGKKVSLSNLDTPIKTVDMQLTKTGSKEFLVIDEGGVVQQSSRLFQQDAVGKKLDEVLGKGLADKIMEKQSGTLSGKGLKFGGEWAHNLYDRQVRDIVKDLTGAKIEKLDMGLPISKRQQDILRIGERYGSADLLHAGNWKDTRLSVGKTIWREGRSDNSYIITDILGDGKFKAVPKSHIDSVINDKRFATNKTIPEAIAYLKKVAPSGMKPFDISQKLTTQQGIKLTPEIKAKIRGEAPKIKTSGEMFESSLEPLAKEARKFKTAEEFVEAQPKFFHGTAAKEFEQFDPLGINFFTKDPLEAQGFAEGVHLGGGKGGEQRVLEVTFPTKKVKNITKSVQEALETGDVDEAVAKGLDKAKEDGFDAISFSHPSSVGDGEFLAIVPVDNSLIKTKSQLTDFFNRTKRK